MSKLFAVLVALSIAYSVQGKPATFFIVICRLIVKLTKATYMNYFVVIATIIAYLIYPRNIHNINQNNTNYVG